MWSTKKQAELDKATLSATFWSTKVRLAAVGAALGFGFLLQSLAPDITTGVQSTFSRNQPQPAKANQSGSTSTNDAATQQHADAGIAPRSDGAATVVVQDKLQPAPQDVAQPTKAEERPQATPQDTLAPAKAEDDAAGTKPRSVLPTRPSQPQTAADDLAAAGAPAPGDVPRVQARLRDVGFLKTYRSGVWDDQSRNALRDFKVVNRLTNSDLWDAQSEKSLYSRTAIPATHSFIGKWSFTSDCVSAQADNHQVWINAQRAKSDGGLCEFTSFQPASVGWRVQAVCMVGTDTWNANILLQASEDRLIWSSERGRTTYFRCR